MERDRTTRAGNEAVSGIGLVRGRQLITRPPGAGGAASLLLGGSLVVVAILVFVAGFQSERSTLGLTPGTFAEVWNAAAASTTRTELALPEPVPRDGEDGDLVFEHSWSNGLSLRGRVDARSNELVEATVLGDPSLESPELIAAAIDLLVAGIEPDLTADERVEVLQELGVIGGTVSDGEATRGGTDFRAGYSEVSGLVGVGAAPHSDPL